MDNMHLRNIFLLNLFVSLTLSQEQLESDIDGEASDDRSGILNLFRFKLLINHEQVFYDQNL